MMKDAYLIDDNPDTLKLAMDDLGGYNKILSILFLKKINYPVLSGIIVTKWSDISKSTIDTFCKLHGFTSLLLRHDKNPEKPPYPRGGYLVELEKIEEETKKYLADNRLVFWLEPANYLHNVYSINCLFDREVITLEVVGPGFDASDLQRGDQTPHEVINMDIATGRVVRRQLNAKDTELYKKSVSLRYLKIAANLERHKKIELLKNSNDTMIIYQTKKYLLEHSFDLLTRNEKKYVPMPNEKLINLYSYLKNIVPCLSNVTKVNFPFVVSCGYIHSIHRLVFWDITWPARKYS